MNVKELSSKLEQLKENINHAKWMYFNADLGSDTEAKHRNDLVEYRRQLDKLLETKLGDLIEHNGKQYTWKIKYKPFSNFPIEYINWNNTTYQVNTVKEVY